MLLILLLPVPLLFAVTIASSFVGCPLLSASALASVCIPSSTASDFSALVVRSANFASNAANTSNCAVTLTRYYVTLVLLLLLVSLLLLLLFFLLTDLALLLLLLMIHVAYLVFIYYEHYLSCYYDI